MSEVGSGNNTFWQGLQPRFSALWLAGRVELSILHAQIDRIFAQRAYSACAAECGGLAISEHLKFADSQLAAVGASGSALLDELKREGAEQASLRASLASLDSKSESAKISEVRGRIKSLSNAQKRNRAKLVALHHQLGEQIIASGEHSARFSDQLSRRAIASERISRAESLIASADLRRKELNASIGVSFRKLAVAVVILLLTVVSMHRLSAHGSQQVDPAPPPRQTVADPTPTRIAPPLPEAYSVLATCLADDIKLSATDPDPNVDFDQMIGRFRQGSFDLEHASSNDAQLDSISRDASEATSDLMNEFLSLQSLPHPQGPGEDFAESLLRGFLGGYGAGAQLDRNTSRRDDIVNTVRQVIATISRLEADKVLLPRIASRYAGPQTSNDHCVDIDYDGVWGPHGPDDWLTLRNSSGLRLHHCTILVELSGEDGDARQNLHFVPDWSPDQFVYAKYRPGQEWLDQTVGRGLVKRCASLKLSIWCDEFVREGMVYTYAGAERDKDVARYCAAASVSASYQPPSTGFLGNASGKATLTLGGIDFFPPSHAKLTFHNGDQQMSYSCDVSQWNNGENKYFGTSGLQWQPESVDVALSFDDTGFVWQYSIQLEH